MDKKESDMQGVTLVVGEDEAANEAVGVNYRTRISKYIDFLITEVDTLRANGDITDIVRDKLVGLLSSDGKAVLTVYFVAERLDGMISVTPPETLRRYAPILLERLGALCNESGTSDAASSLILAEDGD